MMETGKMPSLIVEEQGLKQVSNTGALEAYCKNAIAANPGPVADIKAGKTKAIAALIGSVMKESKGQANPQKVTELLQKLLSSENPL